MVGSNLVSGLGRVAQCEALESRSLFSVATPDTAFSQDGETVIRFGGTNEVAAAGAVLKSGRVLVAGSTYLGGETRIALAVLNRDGTLSNSFDGDGKLVLSRSIRERIGSTDQVIALPDGNALIVGNRGMAKVLAKGGLDTTFGAKRDGVADDLAALPSFSGISSAYVDSGGNFRVAWTTEFGETIHLSTYNAAGIKVADAKVTVGANTLNNSPQFLQDGSLVAVTFKADNRYRLMRLDNTLKPVKNFPSAGVDITAALLAYFDRHELSADADIIPGTQLPSMIGTRFLLNTDGTVAWESHFFGKAAGVANETATSNSPFTRIAVNIANDGKRVSVYGGGMTGGGLDFVGVDDRDANTGVNGRFLTTTGEAIDVKVASGKAFLEGTALDLPDRSMYVFGRAITVGADARDGFVVASVKAPEALATGLLFNDLNADGIINTETKENSGQAGKIVYLDTNNNNVLDADEYSTVTDASGRYFINGLAGGEYRIRRVNAAGYQYTTNAQRYNQTNLLPAGTQYDVPIGTINKGVVQGLLYEDVNGQIGPRFSNQLVFLDLDKDGKLDANEPSTKTDSTGFFRLVAPSSGTFRVTAATPSGYKAVGQPKGYSDVYLGSTSLVNVSFSYRKI